MGLFSNKEKDAIEQIEKINRRIKIIREMMRQSPNDQLTRDNINDAALLLNECASFWHKYESYVSRMDYMQKTLFYGMVVDCWNGERVGVNTWETYFKNIFSALTGEVRRLS